MIRVYADPTADQVVELRADLNTVPAFRSCYVTPARESIPATVDVVFDRELTTDQTERARGRILALVSRRAPVPPDVVGALVRLSALEVRVAALEALPNRP